MGTALYNSTKTVFCNFITISLICRARTYGPLGLNDCIQLVKKSQTVASNYKLEKNSLHKFEFSVPIPEGYPGTCERLSDVCVDWVIRVKVYKNGPNGSLKSSVMSRVLFRKGTIYAPNASLTPRCQLDKTSKVERRDIVIESSLTKNVFHRGEPITVDIKVLNDTFLLRPKYVRLRAVQNVEHISKTQNSLWEKREIILDEIESTKTPSGRAGDYQFRLIPRLTGKNYNPAAIPVDLMQEDVWLQEENINSAAGDSENSDVGGALVDEDEDEDEADVVEENNFNNFNNQSTNIIVTRIAEEGDESSTVTNMNASTDDDTSCSSFTATDSDNEIAFRTLTVNEEQLPDHLESASVPLMESVGLSTASSSIDIKEIPLPSSSSTPLPLLTPSLSSTPSTQLTVASSSYPRGRRVSEPLTSSQRRKSTSSMLSTACQPRLNSSRSSSPIQAPTPTPTPTPTTLTETTETTETTGATAATTTETGSSSRRDRPRSLSTSTIDAYRLDTASRRNSTSSDELAEIIRQRNQRRRKIVSGSLFRDMFDVHQSNQNKSIFALAPTVMFGSKDMCIKITYHVEIKVKLRNGSDMMATLPFMLCDEPDKQDVLTEDAVFISEDLRVDSIYVAETPSEKPPTYINLKRNSQASLNFDIVSALNEGKSVRRKRKESISSLNNSLASITSDSINFDSQIGDDSSFIESNDEFDSPPAYDDLFFDSNSRDLSRVQQVA
eukprot:Pgem_evm1s17733